MKKFLVAFILFLTLAEMPCRIQAQPKETSKSRIETVDGNEFVGIIMERTAETVRIVTDLLGEISIPVVKIKSISEVIQTVGKDGRYWLDNPQATRYFWSPNGYSLRKGEGYYQNVWIMFNQVVYGFTDHFSGGIGVVPAFLFAGASTPAWITLKYSVPVVKDKVNLGAGVLAGTVIGEQLGTAGIAYGISTFGSRDKNINLGLGWAFADGKLARTPTVNIGAMVRTGPKGYLLTENYFVGTPDNFIVMTMLGGRRIINHAGLDFGVVIPIGGDIGTFFALPWLGITIPFGAKSTVATK